VEDLKKFVEMGRFKQWMVGAAMILRHPIGFVRRYPHARLYAGACIDEMQRLKEALDAER
jgi:hypothetical protein